MVCVNSNKLYFKANAVSKIVIVSTMFVKYMNE